MSLEVMTITDSILVSVKEKLGLTAEQTYYDNQLITCINTVLLILYQIGIGDLFRISSDAETWSDFLGSNEEILGMVKDYVPQKVRMLFDPPTSSTLVEATKNNISELEWRLREMNEIFM